MKLLYSCFTTLLLVLILINQGRSTTLPKLNDGYVMILQSILDHLKGIVGDLLDLICKNYGAGGQTYVRWGKHTCREGANLVYAGQVGGSNNHKDSGAAVDYLCLPPDPLYTTYDPKINRHAYVYGAEFVMWNINIKGSLFDKEKYTSKAATCAVCKPSKPSSVIMIPGRNECYEGMTKEYCGFLMAGFHSHAGASQYVCVDAIADAVATTGQSWNKMFYPVESMCDTPLRCPPYIHGAEMTCVVCSL